MRRGAFEQRAANAVAAVRWQDREPELGKIVRKAYVGHGDKREAIVVNGEYRVAVEIDPVDVSGDAFGGKRRAEPQSQVLRGQREKMRHERAARAVVETLDSDRHEPKRETLRSSARIRASRS